MSTTVLPATCPFCGALNDGHTGANTEEAPDPGSLSICIYCRRVSIFAADLSLREPTEIEHRSIRADPTVAKVIAAIGGQQVRAN